MVLDAFRCGATYEILRKLWLEMLKIFLLSRKCQDVEV